MGSSRCPRGGRETNDQTHRRLHLDIDDQFVPARKAHPAFLVDDLPGLRDRLTAAAVPVLLDEPLPGYDRFYATDPFGNRIEILSPRR